MKRSIHSWLLSVACILVPSVCWASPPSIKHSIRTSVGLQARCPLSDGTWDLPSIFGSSCQLIVAEKAHVENHSLETDKTIGKAAAQSMDAPLESTLCLEVMGPTQQQTDSTLSTNVGKQAALNSHKSPRNISVYPRLIREEYCPYDFRIATTTTWQLKDRYLSHTSNVSPPVNQPNEFEVRITPPSYAEFHAACNMYDAACMRDEAAWRISQLHDYVMSGKAQGDAGWLLARGMSLVHSGQARSHHIFISVANSVSARPESILLENIPEQSELVAVPVLMPELPSVCTPPPEYLLLPRVKSSPKAEISEEFKLAMILAYEHGSQLWEHLADVIKESTRVAEKSSEIKR